MQIKILISRRWIIWTKSHFKNWSSMNFCVDDSPAAKALGSLFKLTEVHLWWEHHPYVCVFFVFNYWKIANIGIVSLNRDDGSSEVAESSYIQESIVSFCVLFSVLLGLTLAQNKNVILVKLVLFWFSVWFMWNAETCQWW